MKKILCMLLTLILTVGMFSAAFADGEEESDTWADRDAFYAFKSGILANLRSAYAASMSDEADALYSSAINTITDIFFDESKTLEENEAIINSIVNSVSRQVAALNEPADYSGVDAAIASLPSGEFTAESYTAVLQAIGAVKRGYKRYQQSKVDGWAQAIRAAIAALVPVSTNAPADYSAVDAALASIPSDLSVYTDASVSALNSAVNAVVRGLSDTEQSRVNAMAANIRTAISNLVRKSVEYADYSGVDAELAKIPANLSLYTDATAAVVTAAKNAVVRNYTIDRQAEVDTMAANIRLAVAGLVLKTVYADYSGVDAELAKIPANLSLYTDATAAAVTAAKNAVVRNYTVDRQAEVDTMAANIRLAVKALVMKGADYSKVDAAIAKIPSNLSLYTTSTASAVTNAKNAVVRGYKADKQSQVDTMATNIENAVKALVMKDADYSKVDAAIAKIPSNLNLYTTSTASAVTNAKNAVVRGYKADKQSQVDTMATNIENAVKALVMKDADYSTVDAALARIPSDLDDYTDESVAAVNTAKNAVVRGLKIDRQSEVDLMAVAIDFAVANLDPIVIEVASVDNDFENTKLSMLLEADMMLPDDASDASVRMVENAKQSIMAYRYDKAKSYDANVSALRAILNKLRTDLKDQTKKNKTVTTPHNPLAQFADVVFGSEWYDGIRFCVTNGLMKVASDTAFGIDGNTTRAVLVAALWKLAGEPEAGGDVHFSDVDEKTADYGAIAWIAGAGILTGNEDGTFGPDEDITRNELALALYRFAKLTDNDFTEAGAAELPFGDLAEADSETADAICWCRENGILSGASDDTFDPEGTVTRGETADSLMRLSGNINK